MPPPDPKTETVPAGSRNAGYLFGLALAAVLGGTGAVLLHGGQGFLGGSQLVGSGLALALALALRRSGGASGEPRRLPQDETTASLQGGATKPLEDKANRLAEQKAALEAQAEELRAARDEALRAMQAKDVFLASMSHELRTPLNAVIGLSDLLVDTRLDAQQKEYVEIIAKSSHALLELISDILDMSKLGAGKLEPEARAFEVSACVEDALDLVSMQAQQKGLALILDLDESVPVSVVSDLARLRQVLVNLLSNAVKFTAKGSVSLRVRARPPEDGCVELRFDVQDTGIGIPRDRMDRLFLPFSQLDASTTREYGGTGLGLAISRALVELLGGRLWAESEAGQGATFSFSITAPVEPLASWRPLDGLRALVLDELPASRNATAVLLRGLGAIAVAAASEAEALALAAATPPQLLFLDLAIKGSDGSPALLSLQRRLPDGCQIFVMAPRSPQARASMPPTGRRIKLLPKPFGRSALARLLLQEDGVQGAEPSTSEQTSSLRILIVEDNAINRRVLLKMLERLGHRASAVEGGEQALEAIRRERFHLVLLDVNMPGMDGHEVASILQREFPPHRRPRIVGATANALPGDRERCIASGMDDYLSKPIELAALSNILAAASSGALLHKQLTQSAVSLLDPVLIQKIREGDHQGDVSPLISSFLDQSPALLAALLQAISSGDLPAISASAVALNRMASRLGAVQLSANLTGVEILLRENRTDEIAALAPDIERLHSRTLQALQHLSRHSSGRLRVR